MKFGLILTMYTYNQQRIDWAKRGINSLSKTKISDNKRFDEVPILYIIQKDNSINQCFGLDSSWIDEFKMLMKFIPDPPGIGGSDNTFLYGVHKILEETDVTHVVWLCDDIIVNPNWLIELEALINRHPDAKAWSVRRSAHVHHHAHLYETENDICVRSLDGLGLTTTREEWLDWGIKYTQGDFTNPVEGCTLDLYHAYYRPGERWCTKNSYIDHIGSQGLHVKGSLFSSVNFIGEE